MSRLLPLALFLTLPLGLLSSPAAAHPLGSNLRGHRLTLALEPGRLGADYLVELPTAQVLDELKAWQAARPGVPTEVYTAELSAELMAGLRLLVDGQPVAWAREDQGKTKGEADSRFVSTQLHLSATLPEGARTLQIVNGNLPDEPSLFLVELLVSDGLIVDDCSLWERDGAGGLARDRGGQWRMEEESRDLRVSFQARPAAWRALLRGAEALGGGAAGAEAAMATASARAADAPWWGLQEAGRRGARALGLLLGLGATVGAVSRAPTGALLAALGLVLAGLLGAAAGWGALGFDLGAGLGAAALGLRGLVWAWRGAGVGWGRRGLGFLLSLALLPLGLAFIWRGVQALGAA